MLTSSMIESTIHFLVAASSAGGSYQLYWGVTKETLSDPH